MNRTCGALMLALALIGSATGCKKHETEPNASASSNAASPAQAGQREATLAAGLTKAAPFSTLAAAINDTGLSGVLGGKASYTMFAPTDAAFAALGDKGRALRQPEQRAALAALLREHIVPGLLTGDDLDKALQRSGGKPLKLRTMGKGTLTVSREGGTVVVVGADGAKARLTADSVMAGNGAALGVDRVLRALG